MVAKTCSVEGCDLLVKCRGWCGTHYERWRRNGNLTVRRSGPVARDPEEIFWSKVNKTDTCWLWTGALLYGYGTMKVNGSATSPHRFAYELLVRHIPDGFNIDHLCRVRNCVRPDHLEAVTRGENVRRGESPSSKNRDKTHCKNGHPFSGDNLVVVKGRYGLQRQCRICRTECKRRVRARQKIDPTKVQSASITALGERDNWTCTLCGDPVDRNLQWPAPMSKSRDHIVPKSMGGTLERSNLRLAHLGCNSSRKAKVNV